MVHDPAVVPCTWAFSASVAFDFHTRLTRDSRRELVIGSVILKVAQVRARSADGHCRFFCLGLEDSCRVLVRSLFLDWRIGAIASARHRKEVVA